MTKEDYAVMLIKELEGFRSKSYLDGAGKPTLGYGSTLKKDGSNIKMSDTCTEQMATDMLKYHLEHRVYPHVDELCEGVEIPDKVYAVLCSFCYNEGHVYFEKFNFRKYIEAQNWGDYDPETGEAKGLAEKILRYDKVRNPESGELEIDKGLKNRRIKEVRFMLDL